MKEFTDWEKGRHEAKVLVMNALVKMANDREEKFGPPHGQPIWDCIFEVDKVLR